MGSIMFRVGSERKKKGVMGCRCRGSGACDGRFTRADSAVQPKIPVNLNGDLRHPVDHLVWKGRACVRASRRRANAVFGVERGGGDV